MPSRRHLPPASPAGPAMKLTLQHSSIRSTDPLDSWIEQRILELERFLRIDEACVRLAHHRDQSPPYEVAVHLVTPGPDVLATGRDHTVRAAFGKAMLELEERIANRTTRHRERVRTAASRPGGRS